MPPIVGLPITGGFILTQKTCQNSLFIKQKIFYFNDISRMVRFLYRLKNLTIRETA
nr:hypothetical protein [Proteus mirabilis]